MTTSAMSNTDTETSATTKVFRIFIRATPQAIWDAITKPEWTARYGYGLRDELELRPGGKFRGHANEAMKQMGMDGVVVDGEVIESDPPRRLVMTWRMAIDPIEWIDDPQPGLARPRCNGPTQSPQPLAR